MSSDEIKENIKQYLQLSNFLSYFSLMAETKYLTFRAKRGKVFEFTVCGGFLDPRQDDMA